MLTEEQVLAWLNASREGSDLRGITPLCLASYLGKDELVSVLLEKGALVDGRDANGSFRSF
jgi:hypothetical protein